MGATLLIMAAGMGSRYGGNKQVDGLGPNGEILMEYSIYDAIRAGFDKVVFVIKPGMKETLASICGDRIAKKVKVDYAFQDFSSVPSFYHIPEERTKPFGTVELLARIRTALRHTRRACGGEEMQEGRYIVGELVIDYNKHRAYLAGQDAGLTPSEFKILALLGRHPGRVLTYQQMLRELWGPAANPRDNKLLRVHMANLRRKLESLDAEQSFIRAVYGVGYRWEADACRIV